MSENYLTFKENNQIVEFYNQDDVFIGWLERVRVGQWMAWVYLLNYDCYLSASCSDQVRAKQKELNATKKKGL